MSEDEQCFAVAKNANRHNQEVGSFRQREFHILLLLAVAAAFLLGPYFTDTFWRYFALVVLLASGLLVIVLSSLLISA